MIENRKINTITSVRNYAKDYFWQLNNQYFLIVRLVDQRPIMVIQESNHMFFFDILDVVIICK